MSDTNEDHGGHWSEIEQIVPLGNLNFDHILRLEGEPDEKPPHVDCDESRGLTED